MYETVYLEINIVCGIILLLILQRFRASNDRQSASLAYQRVLLATLFVILLDGAWTLVEGRTAPGYVALNYGINVCYMVLTVLISYLWLDFVVYWLSRDAWQSKAVRLLAALPLTVVIAMCILSPWTRWLFTITDGNVYQRGPLLIVSQVVGYGYMFAGGGYSLWCALITHDRERRSEALALSSFLVLPIIGATVAVFVYGLPTVWPATVISLLMVYLNLQSRQISTDALTGLNNRRQFDRYLLSQMEDVRRDERIYLLLLDIDSFKKINDTYGHLAGDRALVQTAGLLRQVCGVWDCFLARYGGDEFAIVFKSNDPARLERFKEDLIRGFDRFNAGRTTPYMLTISVGSSMQESGTDTPASLIVRADRMLYDVKAEKKKS